MLVLGHKTSLNKLKKTESISSILYNHSGVKIEINYEKKTGKFTNIWSLNHMLLNQMGQRKKSKVK